MKTHIKHIIFLLLLSICYCSNAQHISFIENKGQWDQTVQFAADVPGGRLFITNSGLVYNFLDEKSLHEIQHHLNDGIVNGAAVFVDFIGCKQPSAISTNMPSLTRYNYYLGNNPLKWATNVKAYSTVKLLNIYPGIDFEISGLNGAIKTNFIVRNKSSYKQIKLRYRGAQQMFLHKGKLTVEHRVGNLIEDEPLTYLQNCATKQLLPSYYKLSGDTLSWMVQSPAHLNATDTILIDPTIVFSSFSGSVADNFGFTATSDRNGNAYGGGTVYSAGFPVTPGAYQVNFKGGFPEIIGGGSRDIGIIKFSSDGKQLLTCTYLGGLGNEQPHSITCDASGNLYIMGTTNSDDFPVANGFDSIYNGRYDVYITKLSADGTSLLASTYIGGSDDDGFNNHSEGTGDNQLTYNFGDYFRGDIRLDEDGNVFVATVTKSNGSEGSIPIVNAFQASYGGGFQDGWVIALNHSLSNILLSSFLGGNSADAAYSIRANKNHVYIAGGTLSNNLPQTPTSGVFIYHGGVDGFITRLSRIGNSFSLARSVYIGSNLYDQNYFIALDNVGKVYVTGQTRGVFPRVGNVYHENNGKEFIVVTDSLLNGITSQMAFAGSPSFPKLSPSAFMVDYCNRIYFSGWGGGSNSSFNSNTDNTTGLLTTPDAFKRNSDGSDFYLIIFNKNLSSVAYATYYGGNVSQEHVDGGTSHFDESGVIYQSVCAGCGGFSDFPTSPDAYSKVNRGVRPFDPSLGGCNNAVFKISLRPDPKAPQMKDTTFVMFPTDSIQYLINITDVNGDNILIDGYDAPDIINNTNIELIPVINQPGFLQMRLKWKANCAAVGDTLVIKFFISDVSCDPSQRDTGFIKILVKPAPKLNPQLTCVLRGENSVEVRWSNTNVPLNQRKFQQRLVVLRSLNNGKYDSVGMIKAADFPASFIDKEIEDLAVNNYCYRINMVNICGAYGDTSRQSCTNQKDTISPNAFSFTKDTILYAQALKEFCYEALITDREFEDSIFISYAGSLRNIPGVTITTENGSGMAKLKFCITPSCNQIGDTFIMDFTVMDNNCPIPLRDIGKILLVIKTLPPITSLNLPCPVLLDSNKIGIKWSYITNDIYFKDFAVLFKDKDGSIINKGRFPNVQNNYVEQIVDDPLNNPYCFALLAYNTCDLPDDTGTFTCTPYTENQYPPNQYFHYVSVIDNQSIELSFPSLANSSYTLYNFNPFKNVKTIYSTGANANEDTLIVINDLNTAKQQYCFIIEPKNECGLKPKLSQFACSILLNGISEPFKHTLTWTPYEWYRNGTDYHELEEKDLTESNFELLNRLTDKFMVGFDEKLNTQTGIYYYRASARANISGFYSYSNIVELKQAPIVYIPNAYTPNNDGTNDLWDIVPLFVKSFELRLYDRWGRLVFITTDKNKKLAATDMNGEVLPTDVYAYVLNYTGFEGSSGTRTGNLTIFK